MPKSESRNEPVAVIGKFYSKFDSDEVFQNDSINLHTTPPLPPEPVSKPPTGISRIFKSSQSPSTEPDINEIGRHDDPKLRTRSVGPSSGMALREKEAPLYLSKGLTERHRTFELMFAHYKFEALNEFKKQWHFPENEQINQQITDYSKIITIGTGSFGQVILAKNKKTKEFSAIKIMPKAVMIKSKQVQHTLNERRILQAIEFPFLVNMQCSFKDNDNLYIVMDFAQGGELFNFLNHKGKLKERFVKFYAAQLVLALDYLHNLGIVYRDLKPENLVLGKDGYLVITDFGLSKRVKERTWTIAGTPEYLAPEILLNRGYSTAVDWWALGVVMYEMTAGFTPFHRQDGSTMKMYEKIIEANVTYPSHFTTLFQDLLSHLIQRDLTRRFGNLKYGATQIRAHPWFRDIDWYLIYRKKEKPFFIPRLKNDEDTSYFQKYPEDDAILRIGPTDQFTQEFADF